MAATQTLPTSCGHRRCPTLPDAIKHWTMTTLRNRLVKIGANTVRHGRSIAFHRLRSSCPVPQSPIVHQAVLRHQRHPVVGPDTCQRRQSLSMSTTSASSP
jgi:hypothetical protein